jgi:hypothetical protein
MSVLAWQAGSASGSFLTGTIIQGLISVRDPEYHPERWQGTLFVFAMVVVIYLFNVYAADMMPLFNNLLMILHILSWTVVVIVLWAMAPHQSAKAVFTEWRNDGGWSSMALSALIGQISAIYASLSMSSPLFMVILTLQAPMQRRTCLKKSRTLDATSRSQSHGDTLATASWPSW